MTNNINGIDVATNNNIYYSQKAVDELQNTIKRLQEENEKLREEIYATRNNRLKMYESFETECNKYKQALHKLLDKIDEVLND